MTNPLKYLTVFAVFLATLIIAISTRYEVVAQNVAAAGAAGANDYSTPETKTIRGYVYLLDRWTGRVFQVDERRMVMVQQ